MNRVTAIIGLGVVAFAVTLATYVGTHLSNEAISVLTGAVCGVGAMLPAAIIALLALLRRRETQTPTPASPSPAQMGAPQYPPVIVVAPPALPNASASSGWQGLYQSGFAMPSNERQFSVIGEEEGAWNEYRHR
jgi:hypothetical protein